jgi:nucleoside-diphosphate-sugar epimerase
VNVADVARANYLAANKTTAAGVYNIGSGKNITINRLAVMMKKISESEVDIQYAPKRPADVLHCLADIRKARMEIGYRPRIPLPEGLREYLEWYQAESH